MKKLTALLLVLVVAFGLIACGNTEKTPEEPTITNLTGTMEENLNAVNGKHAALELPLMVMTLDLTDLEGLTYNTGLTTADNITDAAICEPMMGQPYSMILVRVAEGTDAKEIAQQMYDNIDMRKWVCMAADTKTAAVYGDVAMFFMVSTDFAEQVTTETMMDAFKAVCGEGVTVIG